MIETVKPLGKYFIRHVHDQVYDLDLSYLQIIMRQCTVKPT